MVEFWIGAIAVVFALLIGLELGLRFTGLATVAQYITDEAMGYRMAPNQKLRRWTKQFQTNRYSMRNGEIQPLRPPNTQRILLLGDSVANGGLAIAQHQTISAFLEQTLMSAPYRLGDRVEVLNASTSSWGPRNELAYLQTFGTFEAQTIVLLLNTDDLFAGQPTSAPVGKDPNYPNHTKPWAIAQLLQRFRPIPPATPAEPDCLSHNLNAIQAIHHITKKNDAELIIAITPLQREVIYSEQRKYEHDAKQKLNDLIMHLEVSFIDYLESFCHASNPASLYRDSIHLTIHGNRLVASILAKLIYHHLHKSPDS